MYNFEYIRAGSVEEALEGLGRVEGARLMAGGTDLIPLVKDEIVSPGAVVDLSAWKDGARIELGEPSPDVSLRPGRRRPAQPA